MLNLIDDVAPALRRTLAQHPLLNDHDALWPVLRRLLEAHAPSAGANLPGAIGDVITEIGRELDLGSRVKQVDTTGNLGIWMGAPKMVADVVVLAHMDRPSFRVRDATTGELYPICANRFPDGEYRAPAKALRFMGGKLDVGARGTLVSTREHGRDTLTFQVEQGQLSLYDTVTLDPVPTFDGETVKGSGLDNGIGVLTALLMAGVLHKIEDDLRERGLWVLVVFTDLEEGDPSAFFGHGAARLASIMPPPTHGCIIADAHTVNGVIAGGNGAGHGTVSSWGRGAVASPNAIALAVDLSRSLNAARPNTVQMNEGYLSRSDDMAAQRWSRVLGMIGAPMRDAHTAHETALLRDLPSAVWWLTYFTLAAGGLSVDIARAYALGR
jgi:putative aminopeptidase FrvX